jgi:ribulose-phosphate 3-epimerase
MFEIVPSINCSDGDFDCARSKVKTSSEFAGWVHLDVADGSMTFNKSWRNHAQWSELGQTPKLEVHCMVEEPEKYVPQWIAAGAKRIIVHQEAFENLGFRKDSGTAKRVYGEVRGMCEAAGVDFMLAQSPETRIETLEPYMKTCSQFQILAVIPGPAGQPFLPVALQKLLWLRATAPDAIIEIDGGINREVAAACRQAGANILIAGSYTLGSPDPVTAYLELMRV